MKKLTSFLLTSLMVCSFTLTGCAAEETSVQTTEKTNTETNEERNKNLEIVLQINNPVMTVNGKQKEIDADGTVPIILNGRTLLPIRAIAEEIGGNISWNNNSKEITLNYNNDEIKLSIDSTAAYLNGKMLTIDSAPAIINNRTMLPIRFIAENFKFEVEWNNEQQLITIIKSDNSTVFDENIRTDDNFILIDGGTFQMGSQNNEPERENDEIQHNVIVDSFYMSKTELTQSEYMSIMGNNPSENKGDNLPVENVTWYDAVKYCNELSKKEGLDVCYTISDNTVTWDKSANGYRLPTEAEWEYASRAGTNTPFNFGDYVNDDNANCYNAYGYNNNASGHWVNDYLEHSVSVNSYGTNGYGLYNMHGNVAEWVWDWYDEYDTNVLANPKGPDSGNYKVVKGGGWNDFPKHIRSAYRSVFPANVPLYSIGIRLVRNAKSSSDIAISRDNTQNFSSKKILIVYFSQTGNTDGLAKAIQETTGADIFRIERKIPYSASHNSQGLYAEALTEQREKAIPELKTYLEDFGLDINQYDTILLGYCNWWASIPAPVRSFLTHYNLSGKNIIPFCSMGGGRFGQTISAVAKLAPNSNIKKGLDVTYTSYNKDDINKWLAENGVSTKN